MPILCNICGSYQPTVQVSPDYDPSDIMEFQCDCIRVGFVYNGEPIDGYWLSPSFVEDEDVQVGERLLPDEFPDWVHKVKMVCGTCFYKNRQQTP